MADESDIIRAIEAQRSALLAAGDLAGFAALLDDDYLHVHGNGNVTDKAATLARLTSQPRRIERGALAVTVWGDAALVIGEQVNRVTAADGREQATRATVTQTLRRRDGVWRFLCLHFTAHPD